ncbi:MAG TPA: alpha/beta hydrolase [Burkholderiaceae bacterium]|nr:alpha/beta hydrolase [Burkholderiaceae bacterium]
MQPLNARETGAGETSVAPAPPPRARADGAIAPPLAALHGAAPPQPRWFADALACEAECVWPVVQGARIETLAWGERGAPGLLLLHGKMAHARWWSFIAPFFAATHRVVALSFSGMGGSDWRDAYSASTMADEAMAAAQAAGLFDAPRRPLVVGHSFGGFVSLLCAQRHGARLAGVFTLDMPLMSREQRQARSRPGLRQAIALRPTKLYPSLAAALARFRFAPEQLCENLYIADHIARTSLKPVAASDGSAAWTWRFDPKVAPVGPSDAALALREAGCPVAIGWGSESALVTPEVVQYTCSLAGPAAPRVEIPGARHHVMVDQPLALVSALRALVQTWPGER